MTPWALHWDAGTLVLDGPGPDELPEGFVWDPRVQRARGPGGAYHRLVLDLHRAGAAYADHARAYTPLARPHRTERAPRDYQQEAVHAWWTAGRRGVVVLPTGAGKSFVAELAIARADRSTLVVAPTLDLVGQWYDGLVRAFGEPVGVLGGGHHQIEAITVATYDSAMLHVDRWGHRFGLVVLDEVHHLPSAAYARIAELSLAPFRLGLTATPERPDGMHARLDALVGPIVYRREITELAGEFLAPYRTEVVHVELSRADREAYEAAEADWRGFAQQNGIRLGGADGWTRFLQACARTPRGREALLAWRRSRELVQCAPAKLRVLGEILRRHPGSRCLVFTNDNATAYQISRAFLVPALTHQTDVKERRALLAAFADGSLPVLATSKVLNEGVDVPAAEVAVVLSGSGTVREHVQRLGRILRPAKGKQAILYEIVVADTLDERTSARRRDHAAYRDA
ncbi:MAG TPA: DEAD/DEAH box helicase family protein [Myxococcota bacterium]|nr:DEAD/DEAH box helicase family protein [Myxococcota bacterium]